MRPENATPSSISTGSRFSLFREKANRRGRRPRTTVAHQGWLGRVVLNHSRSTQPTFAKLKAEQRSGVSAMVCQGG